MRCKSPVETLIEGRRKQLGISFRELAVATVGCERTLHNKMNEPLTLKMIEVLRIFKYLDFSDGLQEEFYEAITELGKGVT